MKTDLFQFSGLCGVFQICWHTECITLTASSFRIGYSSTGIPSPPLALFVAMLSKAHLTSHSRMSGSRCDHTIVITWAMKIFFYSSSVFSWYFFLISSASVNSILFLSFIVPIFAWNDKLNFCFPTCMLEVSALPGIAASSYQVQTLPLACRILFQLYFLYEVHPDPNSLK